MKFFKGLKRVLAMFVTIIIVVTSIQLPAFAADQNIEIPYGGVSVDELLGLLGVDALYKESGTVIKKYSEISGKQDFSDNVKQTLYQTNNSKNPVSFYVKHYCTLENKSMEDVVVKQNDTVINNGGRVYSTADVEISLTGEKTHIDGQLWVKGKETDTYTSIGYSDGKWTLNPNYLKDYYVEDGKLTLEYKPFNYTTTVNAPASGMTALEWAKAADNSISTIYRIKVDSSSEKSSNTSFSLSDGRHYYQYNIKNNGDFTNTKPFIVRNYYPIKNNDTNNIKVKVVGEDSIELPGHDNNVFVDEINEKNIQVWLKKYTYKDGTLIVNGTAINNAATEYLGEKIENETKYDVWQFSKENIVNRGNKLELSSDYVINNIHIDTELPMVDEIKPEVINNDTQLKVTVTVKNGCTVDNIILQKNSDKSIIDTKNTSPAIFTYSTSEQYFITVKVKTKEVKTQVGTNFNVKEITETLTGSKLSGNYEKIKFNSGTQYTKNNSSSATINLDDGYRYYQYKNNIGDISESNSDKVFFLVRHYYELTKSGANPDDITIKQGNTLVEENKLYTDVDKYTVTLTQKTGFKAKLCYADLNHEIYPDEGSDGYTYTLDKNILASLDISNNGTITLIADYTKDNVTKESSDYGIVDSTNNGNTDTITVTPTKGCKVNKIIVSTSETKDGQYIEDHTIEATNYNTDANGVVTVTNTNKLGTFYKYSAECEVANVINVLALGQTVGNWKKDIFGTEWKNNDVLKINNEEWKKSTDNKKLEDGTYSCEYISENGSEKAYFTVFNAIYVDDSVTLAESLVANYNNDKTKFTVVVTPKNGGSVNSIIIKNKSTGETLVESAATTGSLTYESYDTSVKYFVTAKIDTTDTIYVDQLAGMTMSQWRTRLNLRKSSGLNENEYWKFNDDTGKVIYPDSDGSIDLRDGINWYVFHENTGLLEWKDQLPYYFTVYHYYPVVLDDGVKIQQDGKNIEKVSDQYRVYTGVDNGKAQVIVDYKNGKTAVLSVNGTEFKREITENDGKIIFDLTSEDFAGLVTSNNQEKGYLEFTVEYEKTNIETGVEGHGTIEAKDKGNYDEIIATPAKGCKVEKIVIEKKDTSDGDYSVIGTLNPSSEGVIINVETGVVTVNNDNNGTGFYKYTTVFSVDKFADVNNASNNGQVNGPELLTLLSDNSMSYSDWSDKYLYVDKTTRIYRDSRSNIVDGEYYYQIYDTDTDLYSEPTYFIVRHYYPITNGDSTNIEITNQDGTTTYTDKLYASAFANNAKVKIKLRKYSYKNGKLLIKKNSGDNYSEVEPTSETYIAYDDLDNDNKIWTISEGYITSHNKQLNLKSDYSYNNISTDDFKDNETAKILVKEIRYSVDETNNKFTVTVELQAGAVVKNIIILDNDSQTTTLYTGANNTNPATFDYNPNVNYFITVEVATSKTVEINKITGKSKVDWKTDLELNQNRAIWYFSGNINKSIANSDLLDAGSMDLDDGITYYRSSIELDKYVYFTVRHFYPITVETASQDKITVMQGATSFNTSGNVYTDVDGGNIKVKVKNVEGSTINLIINDKSADVSKLTNKELDTTTETGYTIFTLTSTELDSYISSAVADKDGKKSLQFSVVYTRDNVSVVSNNYGKIEYTASVTADANNDIITVTPDNGCQVDKVVIKIDKDKDGIFDEVGTDQTIEVTKEQIENKKVPTEVTAKFGENDSIIVINPNNPGDADYNYEYSTVISINRIIKVDAAHQEQDKSKHGNPKEYGYYGSGWMTLFGDSSISDSQWSYRDLYFNGITSTGVTIEEINVSGSQTPTYLEDGTYYYQTKIESKRSDKKWFIVRNYYNLTIDNDSTDYITVNQENTEGAEDGKIFRDLGKTTITVKNNKLGRQAKLYVNGSTEAIAEENAENVVFEEKDKNLIWTINDAYLLANGRFLSLKVIYELANVTLVMPATESGSATYKETKKGDDTYVQVVATPNKQYTVTGIKLAETEPEEKEKEPKERMLDLIYDKDAIATGEFKWDEEKLYTITPIVEKELVRKTLGEGENPVVKYIPGLYPASTAALKEEILESVYDKDNSPLLKAVYPKLKENEEESKVKEVVEAAKEASNDASKPEITVEYLAATIPARTSKITGRELESEKPVWLPITYQVGDDVEVEDEDETVASQIRDYLKDAIEKTLRDEINFHKFGDAFTDGSCTEIIRVSYKNQGKGDKFTDYSETNITIELRDTRYVTTLAPAKTIIYTYEKEALNSGELLTGLVEKAIENEKLLTYDNEGTPQVITAKDFVGKIKVTPNHLDASLFTQTVVVEFKGDLDYKPSSAEFKVYVLRQGSKLTVKNETLDYIPNQEAMITAIKERNLITAEGKLYGDDVQYGYAVIGLEGDIEGYVALNLNKNSMVINLPKSTGYEQVDTLVGWIKNLLIERGITEFESRTGIKVNIEAGTLDYSDALINTLNTAIETRSLEGIKTLVANVNEYLKDTGIDSETLGGYIDFADSILKKLDEYKIVDPNKIHVKVGVVGTEKEVIPTQAGAYAVIAATTDKNYTINVDAGSLVILPITDFRMDWNHKGNEFSVIEVNKDCETYDSTWYKAHAETVNVDGEDVDLTEKIVYTFSGVSATGDIGLASKEVPTEAGLYYETATVYGNYYKTITRFVLIKKVDTELKLAYVEPDKDPIILDGKIHKVYGDAGFYCGDSDKLYSNPEYLKAVVVAKDKDGNIVVDEDGKPIIVDEVKLTYYDLELLGKDYLSSEFPVDADDYLMVAYYKGSNIYKAALDLENKLTIERRKVKVSVENVWQVYGEPEKELKLTSAHGYNDEDQFPTKGEKSVAEELGIELTWAHAKNVGTYFITPTAKSSLTFNRNYELDGLIIEDLIRLTGEYHITKRPLKLVFDNLNENNKYETEYLKEHANVKAHFVDAYEETYKEKTDFKLTDDLGITYWYTGTDNYGLPYLLNLLPPTNAGTYKVTASPTILDFDNYNYECEDVTVPYIVNQRDLNESNVDVVLDSLVYNGKLQKQRVISIKDKEDGYLSILDYDVEDSYCQDAGDNYTIKITGEGNYKGTMKVKYSVAPKPMSLVFNKLVYVSTYGDKAPDVKPYMIGDVSGDELSCTFMYKGTTATGNTYESVNPPTEAGVYTVTASLAGDDAHNYVCDSITTYYYVLQRNLSVTPFTNIVLNNRLTYNSEDQEQLFDVYIGFTKLIPGVDYEVVDLTNIGNEASEYTLIIKGKGNYTGKLSKEFTIRKKTVDVLYEGTPYNNSIYMDNYDEVKATIDDVCEEDELNIKFVYIDRKTLGHKYRNEERPTDAGDYLVVAYIDNDSDDANNYILNPWTVVKEYKVNRKPIDDADIELLDEALVYGDDNKQLFTASVVFKLEDLNPEDAQHVLVGDKEFEATYEPEIAGPGVYELVLTGKGNFTGEARVPFVVLAKDDDEAKEAGLIKKDGTLEYGNGSIDVYVKGADEDNDFFEAKFDRSAVAAGSGLKAQELSELVGDEDPHVLELFFVVTKPEVPEEKTEKLSKQIGNIFDVDFFKRYDRNDSTTKQLSDSGADVTFVITLSDEMKNKDANVRRDYTLITEHEGKLAIIGSKYDDEANTITFKTHLFSKYYVGYQDIPIGVNTGDSNEVALWFIMAIMAAFVAGTAGYCLYKRKEDEQ